MRLSNLAGVLRDAGLTVVETAGWANRGYAGQDLKEVRGVLWHHTATNRAAFNGSDAPTLNMCVNGRSDLAGPLCNIVLGRNGTVYLVAAGVANHAGAGSAAGIPTNMGNHYLVGIEMESSGVAPWDWTADQLRVAPFLGAALERSYGADLQIGHLEYSSQGKIDPAGWPGGMDGLRGSINALLTGSLSYASSESMTPTEEDDMFTEQDRTVINSANIRADMARSEATNAKNAALEALAVSAQVSSLIGALAAVAKGEPFDEAKLLAGVQAAAASGVKSAIESIDATVTIKGGQ